MNAPSSLAQRAAARLAGRPFDHMRATGALAPGDAELNMRRWQAGAALLRLHNRGWRNPLDGVANPLDGDAAADARAILEEVERVIGLAHWPILCRVVIEGAALVDCRALVGLETDFGDAIVRDRLRTALDRVGPMLGVL